MRRTSLPARWLWLVLVVALVLGGAGCATTRTDSTSASTTRSLPSRYDTTPDDYGHPLRITGFILYPIGLALDYLIVRPFYLLAREAPGFFGYTRDDEQAYQRRLGRDRRLPDSPRFYE